MFPLAIAKGDVKTANPQNTSLGLQFFYYPESADSNTSSFKPTGITFLIDGDRYKKKVLKNDAIFFEDHSLYIKLIKADKVRARLEGKSNYYEVDMSSEVRSVIRVMLSNITSIPE